MSLLLTAGRILRKLPHSVAAKTATTSLLTNWTNQSANFSSTRGGKKIDPNVPVPDEFFDRQVEEDKQFLDYASAIIAAQSAEGLESLTSFKDELVTWDDLEPPILKPNTTDLFLDTSPESREFDEDDMEGEEEEEEVDDLQVDSDEDFANLMEEPVENLFNSPDVAEHLDELLGKEDKGGFVTIPQLNYSIPWRTVEDVADNELTKFTAESSGDLFTQDTQGLRSCDGHKQRSGREGILRCHKLDIQLLDHLDLRELTRFLAEDAEILGRRETGLCAKCQRKVAKCVKRARNYGLLSHLGQYTLVDSRPYNKSKIYHDNANLPDDAISPTCGLKETKTIG